jgi:hypothetical protein
MPPILIAETTPGDNPPLEPEELLVLVLPAAGALLAEEDTGVDEISVVV